MPSRNPYGLTFWPMSFVLVAGRAGRLVGRLRFRGCPGRGGLVLVSLGPGLTGALGLDRVRAGLGLELLGRGARGLGLLDLGLVGLLGLVIVVVVVVVVVELLDRLVDGLLHALSQTGRTRCQLLLGATPAPAGRSRRAPTAACLGLGLGAPPALELVLPEPGEDDRDVAGALADARPPTPGPGPPPLQRRTLVGEGAGHEQL